MARIPLPLALSLLVAPLTAHLACSGDDSSSGSGASGGSGGSGASTTTTTTSGSGGSGQAGGTSTGGAPPCTATTLAESVRTTSVAIAGASGSRALTAEVGAGSVVAWVGADGKVHATPLDAADQRAGDDVVVDGMQVFGVAATATEVTLLVSRAPDYMTFLRVGLDGTVATTTNLVGGGDHGVEGTEWFGEFATTGRLVAQADGTFAAYHALHRHWPDGIGHQGDTLRLLDGNGAPIGGGWDWGCSHSMDQRLAVGPTGLVPICIADCYPGKGIYFAHDAAEITTDPAANCAGGYSTALGGLVATADGFFLVYQDAQGAAHLGHFDGSGQPLGDRALGVPGSSKLGHYAGGMLLASAGGLQQLDAAGNDVGALVPVAAALPDQDFESRSDGAVAWATAAGATLSVVRVLDCP